MGRWTATCIGLSSSLGVLVAGCGTTTPTASPTVSTTSASISPKHLIPLKLAYGAPAIVSLPLWAAYDLKFFQHYGFQPSPPVLASSSNSTAVLVSGAVNLVATGAYPTAVAVQSGAGIRMVGVFNDVAGQVLVTKHQLTSPQQLIGLKFGGAGPTSEPVIETELYLKKLGIRSDQVTFVHTGLESQELAALQKGLIDAGGFEPPEQLVAQANGMHVFTSYFSDHIPWITTGYDVSSQALRQHPHQVQRMMAALRAATRYLLAHPTVAKQEIAKHLKFPSQSLINAAYTTFQAQAVPNLEASTQAVQAVAQFSHSSAQFYDPSVLQSLPHPTG